MPLSPSFSFPSSTLSSHSALSLHDALPISYQMFHTIAILITGLLVSKIQQPSMHWAGWLFLIGIILFSGSLYTYAVSGAKFLAMITPFGGMIFLAAWIVLGYSVLKFL